MSRISYRLHCRPQSVAASLYHQQHPTVVCNDCSVHPVHTSGPPLQQRDAHWMDFTMLSLRAALSSNVLSRVIFPSSERMVVCANCATPNDWVSLF